MLNEAIAAHISKHLPQNSQGLCVTYPFHQIVYMADRTNIVFHIAKFNSITIVIDACDGYMMIDPYKSHKSYKVPMLTFSIAAPGSVEKLIDAVREIVPHAFKGMNNAAMA